MVECNATVKEIDNGPFYNVRLEWLPRPGDLIDLTSYVEMSDKKPWKLQYEVVQVVHLLSDVSNRFENSGKGGHLISIFVKPTESNFFE